jgi:Invasion associated locus B (IalB) protein
MQRIVSILAAVLVLSPVAALAQIKTLATGQIWSAYSADEKGGPTCYLVGHPAKSLPAGAHRNSVDAMVSHRVGEKAYYVVNFDLGYAAKEGAKAELNIDGKKFALFIEKDAAWSPDASTDKAISESLARGRTATLKATSAHGTSTTDTYTLEGFSAALKAIDKACKAPR